MTYETYHLIFVTAAALAGAFFAAACILFVVLKIPRVAGDLSGTTARKAIRSIREQTEQSEKYRGSAESRESMSRQAAGSRTGKAAVSGRLHSRHTSGLTRTEKIAMHRMQGQGVKQQEVKEQVGITEVLQPLTGGDETTVLTENMAEPPLFEIEQDITYIHTEETVE